MNELELKEEVINIISNHKTGILASVEDNKPHCRYMTFYNKELTLFTPTKKDTEKYLKSKIIHMYPYYQAMKIKGNAMGMLKSWATHLLMKRKH